MQKSSDEELLGIIENSLNYSSGDNCQPFNFKIVNNDEFEILYDRDIAKHRVNFGEYTSILALGSLIESLNIQAACAGYDLQVNQLLANVSNLVWAKIKLVKKQSQNLTDSQLAPLLKLRCTDRRPFSREHIPTEIKNEIYTEAAHFQNIQIVIQDELSSELSSCILNIEEEFWKDLKFGQDLVKWIRFSNEEALRTRDGLPWPNLGAALFLKPILKSLAGRPRLHSLLIKLGSSKGARHTLSNQIENCGGFGWLSIEDKTPETVVEVGRCYFRVWLILTKHGYGFQPLTASSFGTFAYLNNLLPEDWSEKMKKLYRQVEGVFRSDLKLSNNEIPIWGFRAGKISPLDQSKRTYRKKLETVLIK